MQKLVSSMGFIGSGSIATALARGLIATNVAERECVIASGPTEKSTSKIQEELSIRTTLCNRETVRNSQVVFLAVKPHNISTVLKEVTGDVTPDHLIISLAAGTTLKTMEESLPDGAQIMRAMPNTPCSVGAGMSAISAGSAATNQSIQLTKSLFTRVGICRLMSESYLDIITGLSGCGPTYMYMTIEALADGGVRAGLTRELATIMAAQTMLGAAKMVLENPRVHPGEMKDDVCSPAGASIQAVHVLEKAGYRGILMDAIGVSCNRCIELSKMTNGDNGRGAPLDEF
ncbi:pyrroline-5-carboxylate reductase 2-like [Dysidea avara]|uniref:pyrroline-5-carboxylate reductase 2-like n=1 Tax=Dysidea avara TaxID=196820 RepID=UPI00332EA4E4